MSDYGTWQPNDGGPAYPHCYEESGHPRWRESQGMSLRDYFAGQALAGICAAGGGPKYDFIAAHAYALADAMLKAREVKS